MFDHKIGLAVKFVAKNWVFFKSIRKVSISGESA